MMADTTSMRFAPLNDSNYAEWSIRMKAYLIRRKLWKVVDILEEGKSAKAFADELEARSKDLMDEACAEMTLMVEGGQLSHMQSPDPREIWLTLRRVHRAAGFATSLALQRRFVTMKKGNEPMQAWIGAVKALAFRLEYAGIAVSEQDMILALTVGLPNSYEAVIINFDATPAELLTLDHVIARLLNEETRQDSSREITKAIEPEDEAMAVTSSAGRRWANSSKQSNASQEICYWCEKAGHRKSDCFERQAYFKNKEKKAAGVSMAVTCNSDSDDDCAF